MISTISGAEQINLIDAARRARVRRFVPSEFEGAVAHRPGGDDPLDEDSATARSLLQQWSQSEAYPIRSTVFSCGVFYERFAPGGLEAYNMGSTWSLRAQGSYLLDLGAGTGDIPITDSRNNPVHLVLTSAYDVARFLAMAVELGIDNWPAEFRIIGARLSTDRLRQICSEDRGSELCFPNLQSKREREKDREKNIFRKELTMPALYSVPASEPETIRRDIVLAQLF